MKNLNNLLKKLLENEIEFVLVGGFASAVHGSTMVTRDIDICYACSPASLTKLRDVLGDINPVHRQTPKKLSFIEVPKNFEGVNNVYLDTDLGVLDVISQITGVGDFERVKENAIGIKLFGYPCKVISIDDLIKSKETLGRRKDLLVVEELKEIKKK